MKKIYSYIIYFFTFATFFNCAKDLYEIPENLVVHDFVWKGLNAYYLHQDQIPNLADTRFNSDQQLNSFLSASGDHNQLFSSLLQTNDIKSILIEDYTTITPSVARTAKINGMEFGLIEDPENTAGEENLIGYVTHILPNSDAATKNIKRGEFFTVASNQQIAKKNYRNLLITGTDTLTFRMVDFDGKTAILNNKKVFLEKKMYNYSTAFLQKTITEGTDKIGYLMYNNDFSEKNIPELNTAFLNFQQESINKLIIDLRYTIGGESSVKFVNQLASLITGQFPTETLIKEEWNKKAQPWFLLNQPDSLITKFTSKLNATTNLNSLQLNDVYIVLNGTSFTGSSAIELLINSLKPHIKVTVIGTQTTGNNTGFTTLYNSEDYDFLGKNTTHTVALRPQVLKFLNKNDATFENGFRADIQICANEDLLNLGVLGEKSEPILNTILTHISTGSAVISSPCNPNKFVYFFNSIISQTQTDTGVSIAQNLPNTYINSFLISN